MVKPLCLKAMLALACGIGLCVTHAVTRADDLDNITFEGTVRDSAGAVIRAADVRAMHVATGIERATTTDAEGHYRIVMREPGIYRLNAWASGFNREESQVTEVTTGRGVKIDFQLSTAGVSEQITVGATSAPPAIIRSRPSCISRSRWTTSPGRVTSTRRSSASRTR